MRSTGFVTPAGRRLHLEPSGNAGVRGQNARPAGVRDDRHAPARGQRLQVETCRDVEHLVDRVGADDACLLKQPVDGQLARGQARRMAGGGAQAGRSASRLHDDDRLRARHAPRELAEPPWISERLQIEQHDGRRRIVLRVLEDVVA